MTATRLILSMMLLPLTAIPSEAQRLAPAAVVAESIVSPASSPGRPDTLPAPRREISTLGTIMVGIAGGLVGTFAGGFLGAGTAAGCHGDFCGLPNVLLGAAIGESIGMGLGSHLGSGSDQPGNIVKTSLASAGIMAGGAALGVAIKNSGVVMLPLTPVLQLAAALAIERY